MPEPWVLRHLGPPPREVKPELQALLVQDWIQRAGAAAAYREAAGISDPHQVINWNGHKGNAELEALRADAIRSLQVQDEHVDLMAASRGQLEARVIAGQRARAAAPPDVSADLRASAQAAQDMRAEAADAQVRGEYPAAWYELAGGIDAASADLEAQNAAYEAWSRDTAAAREEAGRAQAELERRGDQVPEWMPQARDEGAEPEPEADPGPESEPAPEPEPECEPEAAPEPEREPEPEAQPR